MLPLLAFVLVVSLATQSAAQINVVVTPTTTGFTVTIGSNAPVTCTGVSDIQAALSAAMASFAGSTFTGSFSDGGGSIHSFSISDSATLSSAISSISSAYSASGGSGTSTSGGSSGGSGSGSDGSGSGSDGSGSDGSSSDGSSSDGKSGERRGSKQKKSGSGEGRGRNGKGGDGKTDIKVKVKCFSADTRVNTDRGEMSMEELFKAGDISVQVGQGQMAQVTSWIHAQPEAMTQFNKITTEAGSVSVTDGHLVYLADGQVVSAGKVKQGDRLMTAERNPVEVINVEKVESRGYYAPLTSTGNIVVNGHLASCYSEVESPVLGEIMFKYIQAFAGTVLPQSVQAKLFNVGRPETVMAFIELSQKFMAP